MKIWKLYKAQQGMCFWCKKYLLQTPAKKISGKWDNGWTREHVIPRSLGGEHFENIVLSCHRCNSTRKSEVPDLEDVERCKRLWGLARGMRGHRTPNKFKQYWHRP